MGLPDSHLDLDGGMPNQKVHGIGGMQTTAIKSMKSYLVVTREFGSRQLRFDFFPDVLSPLSAVIRNG